MKMNPDDAGWSVAQQEHDPQSVLNFWRKVLALRKEHIGLVSGLRSPMALIGSLTVMLSKRNSQVYGKFALKDPDHASMFVYTVEHSSENFLVVMNWSDRAVKGYDLPLCGKPLHLLLSNYPGESEAIDVDVMQLVRAWEARLYSY